MAQFINSRETLVQEALDGLVACSGGKLQRLDGYPYIRVVLRSDWNRSKVAVISGGGSGHEPAHAGFVGAGMLTAAVCGDVFASPSVDSVLAGILAVTGKAGCVLIVKNYTGDRLNFGLAAEKARVFGLKVNMIIVKDDISIPGLNQPRGLAGTLLVHKMAGAVSDAGGDLEQVTQAARRAATGAMSVGMALDTCTVPGSTKEIRLQPGEAELGLGIHGEPGVRKVDFVCARDAVAYVTEILIGRMRPGPHVVLLNNLGSTTGLEMSILAAALRASSIGPAISHIIGPAAMMTALDMHGFSVTLYPLSPEDTDLLAATTSVHAWPGLRPFLEPTVVPLPDGLLPLVLIPSAHPANRAFLTCACNALIAAESDLNQLDAKSGDGDTGSTLATAAKALLVRLDQLPLADDTQLFRAIGQELSQTMGGSSGVLLALFFAASGDALARGLNMSASLKVGLERIQEVGGAKAGDRTMIDALQPALDALPHGLPEAAVQARDGANKTAALSKALAGRAAYISPEQLQGHIDPGAEAVARLFDAISQHRAPGSP